jgi:hypothetical protein
MSKLFNEKPSQPEISAGGSLIHRYAELALDSEPVHFLRMVPLTNAGCNLKLAEGTDAILELFGQNRHPHVFDPARTSYV